VILDLMGFTRLFPHFVPNFKPYLLNFALGELNLQNQFLSKIAYGYPPKIRNFAIHYQTSTYV